MTDAASLASLGARIHIQGCGAMAGAMLTRWLACGIDPAAVTAVRIGGGNFAPGVATLDVDDPLPATMPDVLLLGVKPQQLGTLAPLLDRLAGPETLVLSILAGVPLAALAERLPRAGGIVRLMPNLPVAEGRGIVAHTGNPGSDVARTRLDALLAPLGHVQPLADEGAFDLVTALTGCGPAFTYRFVAALTAAAGRLGLPAEDADRLARLTVAGAAATLAQSADSANAMASAVASPGGMTQAGLDVLDDEGRLIALMTDTLRAARDRGRELAAIATAG